MSREPVAQVRLAPVWAMAVVAALGPVCLLTGLLLTADAQGLDRLVGVAYLVLGVAGTVAGAVGLWPRRHGGPAAVADDGAVSWAAPAVLVGAVLACWAAAWSLVVLLAVTVATGGASALERPGAALVLAVVALTTVPDVFALVTGRLHRWRLVLDADGVSYRGRRRAAEVPWTRVRGAHLQASRLIQWRAVPTRMRPDESGPRGYGVVIEVAGKTPDILVPQFFLRAPAAQLLAEIERARAAHR